MVRVGGGQFPGLPLFCAPQQWRQGPHGPPHLSASRHIVHVTFLASFKLPCPYLPSLFWSCGDTGSCPARAPCLPAPDNQIHLTPFLCASLSSGSDCLQHAGVLKPNFCNRGVRETETQMSHERGFFTSAHRHLPCAQLTRNMNGGSEPARVSDRAEGTVHTRL